MLFAVLKNLFTGKFGGRPDDSGERLRIALQAGNLPEANFLLTGMLGRMPDDAGLWRMQGEVYMRQGDNSKALGSFSRAITLEPKELAHHMHAAQCHKLLGDTDSAKKLCKEILCADSNFSPAHLMWANLELPGPEYMEVLKHLHQTLTPATYLEIGVQTGRTMALALSSTQAIGVDPEPKINVMLEANARIFDMTSDDFFAQQSINAEFGGRSIDMAFIDGMHHFDFALRDFAAIERNCSRHSIVLIHDCYPLERVTAARDRVTGFWSGDVWKAIMALKKYRPDLDINTIAAAPTGLALIRNLNPDSHVLTERMDEIVADMNALDFDVLEKDKRGALNWFPNDWRRINELLVPLDKRHTSLTAN